MKRVLSLLAVLSPLPVLAADTDPIKLKVTETTFDFLIGEELVARYHKKPELAKPYLWPLYAPGQVAVTRGWPMQTGLPQESKDHVHQKSAWFCHGDVIPEGIEIKVHSGDKNVKGVDFWSEGKGHGKIVCVAVSGSSDEGGVARVPTDNEWLAPDGTKILDERRTITVRNFGDARLIVFEIDLHASVCPITFGDTKEGSMGVRVNDEFRLTAPGSNGVVTSSDGSSTKAPAKDNLPMWGKRADWHDYSGSVDGKLVGIAMFDHPKNQYRAAWHTRAYGLLSANPFGRASFPGTKDEKELVKLAKGEHLKLKYGLLVHTGDAKAAKVGERFADFAR